MYEKPELNRIGKAGDVILGASGMGPDIDGQQVYRDFEFASDTHALDTSCSERN